MPASLSQPYRAAREAAALLTPSRGLLVVSGRDRASYLQGLLTNDVSALTAGQGCYAAYLTAQGRMISDLHVYELGDVLLLTLPPQTTAAVLAKLDQFIFSEDVQLGDVSATFAAIDVLGPDASRVIATATGIGPVELDALPPNGNLRSQVLGQPVILLRVDDTGVNGFELLAPPDLLPALLAALRGAGSTDLDPASAEALRIEAGVPRFGADMDEETIPLEAGIESQAISFTKGCYVGQEIIIRVLHRGHGRVARKLVGLAFAPEAAVPAVGTTLHGADRDLGVVTSSAMSPSLGHPVALGYVKRDAAEPGTVVTTADGVAATVVALPFAPPA
ncbi:MAG: glycine cleavage T C-terminal barrel domain-containing protein [Vicinamibacterales bacterium]